MYSFDTSALMDWWARRFPPDIFPSLRLKMENLAAENQLLLVDLVMEELEVVAPPELVTWVKERSHIIIPADPDIQKEAMQIQIAFPRLLDPKATFEEADPYIIALASRRNGVVVTSETPASTKPRARRSHFIPDVCMEMGIECIDLFGLIRRENWSF